VLPLRDLGSGALGFLARGVRHLPDVSQRPLGRELPGIDLPGL
jgi:hypothetical protein